MQDLRIGQSVLVLAVSTPEYQENDQRVLVRHPIEPVLGIIAGKAVRYEGMYNQGSKSKDFESGYIEYDPPYLSISKCITLWQVKHGMVNKPLLVLDEDLQVHEAVIKIPHQSDRVKYKVEG